MYSYHLKPDRCFSALSIKDKAGCLDTFRKKHQVDLSEIAYIGDDYNDLQVLGMVGLSACPSDAMPAIREVCDHVCLERGGYGAFRELAELIIQSRLPGQ